MDTTLRIALAVTLLSAAACGSSSDGGTGSGGTAGGTSDWTGTLVGSGAATGSLSLVFSSPVPSAAPGGTGGISYAPGTVTVTGTLRIAGSTIALSGGTYDPATYAFAGLAGGGYALAGTVTSTKIADVDLESEAPVARKPAHGKPAIHRETSAKCAFATSGSFDRASQSLPLSICCLRHPAWSRPTLSIV